MGLENKAQVIRKISGMGIGRRIWAPGFDSGLLGKGEAVKRKSLVVLCGELTV